GWPLAQKTARERHDLIKTALDEAARLRQQAADKLADYEARLKAADTEIKQLVEGMRADARKEADRIRAAAERSRSSSLALRLSTRPGPAPQARSTH
ncbi:MAG TPA: ATP synthase F0 subunit B, partial [Usitatibacter sp.]|nr:ATP synthase F0 subunit B [Usitatibacter sp.]